MFPDLATFQSLLQARIESNEVLALACPLLTDADRAKVARPSHAFLSRCRAFFSAAGAQPQIAAFAGLDPVSMDEKLTAMQTIDAALIQNAREAQLLRDARLVLAGEAWTVGLEAYRMAVLLRNRSDAARSLVKEMGELFVGGRRKKEEDGDEADNDEAATEQVTPTEPKDSATDKAA